MSRSHDSMIYCFSGFWYTSLGPLVFYEILLHFDYEFVFVYAWLHQINKYAKTPFCFRFRNNQNTAADLQMFLNYAINRAINRSTIGIQ